MSRIGRAPITIPAGVEVKLDGAHITVKGPKGTLERDIAPQMIIEIDGTTLLVKRPNDEKENRSLHGLTRTLINNMVIGVTEGYEKKLEIVGVGMRCKKDGNKLVLHVGFSHDIDVPETDDIKINWADPNHFSIVGIDKQKVGQFAAEVRGYKPPEPYKGKGIRYVGEVVKHKEGKAGKGKK